ncbi:hypothetical protein C8Q79DRAFT_70713 [Trametes meyenii]|nr:hypothetical protein C8Q79DRAFT_70713 [Trametes meyenii]
MTPTLPSRTTGHGLTIPTSAVCLIVLCPPPRKRVLRRTFPSLVSPVKPVSRASLTIGARTRLIGSQIVIIGATLSDGTSTTGPISAYTLDGAQNSVFLYQANATDATDVTFYNSGQLSSGSHTLDISILSVSNIPFLLDAVYVLEPSSATVSASSTAVWVSTVFVTPSAASSSLADQTTVSGGASTSSTPVGAIVGGVVGGVALLVAAALAIYFLYFRHRRGAYAYHSFGDAPLFDSDKDHPSVKPVPTAPVEPFLAATSTTAYTDAPPYTPSAQSELPPTPGTPHTYPPVAGSVSGSGSGAGSSSGRTLSVVNDAEGVFLSPAQRKAAEAKQRQSTTESVQFHADSGVRFDSEGRPIEASASEALPLADVPPEYTPS